VVADASVQVHEAYTGFIVSVRAPDDGAAAEVRRRASVALTGPADRRAAHFRVVKPVQTGMPRLRRAGSRLDIFRRGLDEAAFDANYLPREANGGKPEYPLYWVRACP
jgi:hypothetical protein